MVTQQVEGTPAEPTARPGFLPADDLDRLLAALTGEGWSVVGPQVADGAIVYDEIASAANLPYGVATTTAAGQYRLVDGVPSRAFDYGLPLTAWKRFVHPPILPLTRGHRAGSSLTVETVVEPPRKLAFLGARACEIAALRIQDRA